MWFWNTFRTCSREDRALILKFCTGTSRVPLDGFEPLFTLTFFKDGHPDGLPNSHTCFNQLDLPEYNSAEEMLKRIQFVLSEGTEGFALA